MQGGVIAVRVPQATACDSYCALQSYKANNIDSVAVRTHRVLATPKASSLPSRHFFSPSSLERDGWFVLHCAHATSTAHFDQNLINLACALREHEG
jgi:hypothetical protein